jgi:hypothetical protein
MSELDQIMNSELSSSSQGGLPHWAKRYLLSLVISFAIILFVKPQAVTEVVYDVQKNQCGIRTDWSKVMLYSILFSAVMYLIIKKYY